MCNGSVCRTCVHQELTKSIGVNAANIVQSTFEHWRNSCPNEDALALGTMIPLYLNVLQFELQYYFLFVISLHFDPLTLSEWGIE